MKRLCTVCARGGSKGVKNKNIRPLLGQPLIYYTIEQARRSGLFDAIAVSSDSEEILAVARQFDSVLAIKRPDALASDTAGKHGAVVHAVLEAERLTGTRFDVVADLDATSPLRLVKDIQESIAMLETTDAPNIITGMPARRSPYFNLVEEQSDGSVALAKKPVRPILRRQDAPRCFDMNASIYVWRRDLMEGEEALFRPKTRLYSMPEERSIDIDSELDFEFVAFLATKFKRFSNDW